MYGIHCLLIVCTVHASSVTVNVFKNRVDTYLEMDCMWTLDKAMASLSAAI